MELEGRSNSTSLAHCCPVRYPWHHPGFPTLPLVEPSNYVLRMPCFRGIYHQSK